MNALRKIGNRIRNWGSAAWRFCLARGRIFCGGPYEVGDGVWTCPRTGYYGTPKGRYTISGAFYRSDGSKSEFKRDATPEECELLDKQMIDRQMTAMNPSDSECATSRPLEDHFERGSPDFERGLYRGIELGSLEHKPITNDQLVEQIGVLVDKCRAYSEENELLGRRCADLQKLNEMMQNEKMARWQEGRALWKQHHQTKFLSDGSHFEVDMKLNKYFHYDPVLGG